MVGISLEDWKPVDLELTPDALKIVKSDENLFVIAGPGAGKTEIMAQRVCYLLQTGICSFPYRILGLSFKRDASTNLRERVMKRCGRKLSAQFDSFTNDAFSKSLLDRFRLGLPEWIRPIPNYRIAIRSGEELDQEILGFKRISELVIELLKYNKPILNALRSTYKYILLDEFQDTTDLQYKLIKAAFKESNSILTAVGDNKQQIMCWAGAIPEIFQRFEDDFNAKKKYLWINYRSKKRLQYIQSYFANTLDNSITINEEENWEDNDGICMVFNFSDENEEAFHVSIIIENLIENKHIKSEEICILTRLKRQEYRDKIIENLSERNISVRIEDDYQDVIAEPINQLIIHFFKLALQNKAPESSNYIRNLFIRIKAYNRDTSFRKIRDMYSDLDKISEEIKNLILQAQNKSDLDKVIQVIIDYLGKDEIIALYPQYIQEYWMTDRIDKLIEFYRDYYEQCNNWKRALELLVGKDSIPLMTIHKSKGLEFDTIIFIGLEDGAFWSYSREDLCAFFVALSRAKDRALFTHCNMRGRWKQPIEKVREIYNIFENAGVEVKEL